MKRKAVKIAESNDKRRALFVDKENAEEIYQYINQDDRHKKKFQFIVTIILNGMRNTEVYDKESFDSKTRGITAMKFFKGQENDRIYCKEIRATDKTFIVIAAELMKRKKTQKLTRANKSIITRIAKYEYELES